MELITGKGSQVQEFKRPGLRLLTVSVAQSIDPYPTPPPRSRLRCVVRTHVAAAWVSISNLNARSGLQTEFCSSFRGPGRTVVSCDGQTRSWRARAKKYLRTQERKRASEEAVQSARAGAGDEVSFFRSPAGLRRYFSHAGW